MNRGKMKTCISPRPILCAVIAMSLPIVSSAQVNSGSNGSDGAFNPTTNTVINMADHPAGIYQYTSVNIPAGVTVKFISNANNVPVTWLVQSDVVINGTVDVSGQTVDWDSTAGGLGGPGGFRGGNGVHGVNAATAGQGPGGGLIGSSGAAAAFGSFPSRLNGNVYEVITNGSSMYGNQYLLPLIGGSGAGGSTNGCYTIAEGGGGGGGAILIASSSTIILNGSINANGGGSGYIRCGGGYCCSGGGASGGAVRFVAATITGTGYVTAIGGTSGTGSGGMGRVRFDTLDKKFSGSVSGVYTEGFQPIITPTPGQLPQLTVTSVGGIPVSASPTGALSTPDAVLSAQQNTPIAIVVNCSNLPLNSQITVSVKPANGLAVSATGFNNTGTLASSTATVLLTIPRGGGLIYATAATGN